MLEFDVVFFRVSIMYKFSKYPIVILVCVFAQTRIYAQPPFHAVGSAQMIAENCFMINATDSLDQAGAIWSLVPLNLEDAFDMQFAVNLGCNPKGGEGIAFVMHADSDSTFAKGCPGSALGFGGSSMYNCTAVSPSLGIELDTRTNSGDNVSDIDANHLSLVKNGILSKPIENCVRASSGNINIKDCNFHKFRVTWRPSTQELKVYFDGELKILHKGDIKNDIFPHANNIWFGFTGSTSQKSNTHLVCINYITLEIDAEYVAKKTFDNSVYIYPNPTAENVVIDCDFDNSQKVNIQLFNSKGEIVQSRSESNVKHRDFTLNLPGLPAGIYYVSVTNGKQRTSKKILHVPLQKA